MGFSNLKAKVKPQAVRPSLVVDLSPMAGEPKGTQTLTFREPRAPDFFKSGVTESFRANYPDLCDPETFAAPLLLMAACYEPDESEMGEEIDAVAELAGMAREYRDLYLYTLNEFLTAYPSAGNMEKAISDAKND